MDKNVLTSELCSALFRSSAGIMCILDENGIFKFVSETVYQHLAYYPEELLENSAFEYLHNNDLQPIKATLAQLATRKRVVSPFFRFRTKHGNWKWMDATVTNMMEEELVNGFFVEVRDVSHIKEIQIKQETGYNNFNSIMDSHPDSVFLLSPDGIFEQINSNVCKLLDYSKDEILGEHFSKFIASSFSFEALKALYQAANNEASSLEGKIVTTRGAIRTLSFSILPITDGKNVIGTLGIAKDITSEKAALKELQKLSLIASKSASCVIITDPRGYIEWVNNEFTRVTGYTMQEAVKKKPSVLLQGPDTDPRAVQFMRKRLNQQIPFSVELLNYRKNGEKFWFHMDITPLQNDDGEIAQFFAIQYDVTERKESEKKMLLLSEDLTRQNRELQQFNYIVSHNLRAPVANILGLISILESAKDNQETFQNVLTKLKQTSINLDNVIKDLDEILSFSDHVNGNDKETVYFYAVCQEVISSLQDKIDAVGATTYITVPEDISINANKAYVYSIFHNLLSNAIKYRNKERELKVSIAYSAEELNHLITFSDNGIGIDMEKHGNQLFKLYGQLNKKIEGRGLGLYMVKTQIESLNGSIEVDSTLQVGTTFYLRFKKNG